MKRKIFPINKEEIEYLDGDLDTACVIVFTPASETLCSYGDIVDGDHCRFLGYAESSSTILWSPDKNDAAPTPRCILFRDLNGWPTNLKKDANGDARRCGKCIRFEKKAKGKLQ